MWLYTQRGFSLVELLTALAISSVVVASMYGAFVQQRVSTQQEQTTEARQNARLSMDAMLEEIREAGFDLADLPGPVLKKQTLPTSASGQLNCNGNLAHLRETSRTIHPRHCLCSEYNDSVHRQKGYLDDQLSEVDAASCE